MLELEKYSLGVGDRFARQAKAQLQAVMQAAEQGVRVAPVWNKSHREHTTIGSKPEDTRASADAAVQELSWQGAYHVDADHINLATVDQYLTTSDFFTIDVTDTIGKAIEETQVNEFVARHPELIGELEITGITDAFNATEEFISDLARQYLAAVRQAGKIYRHIESVKGSNSFITEVSMDETDRPQTPPELLIILAAFADENIPLQTVAPKFSGRFNKGVDYVGDVEQFAHEFDADLAVISHAVKHYGLPKNLKLSVHSGSDKFSLYPKIRQCLLRHDAGMHLKTAGTTWLEELIGMAEAGGEGLELAKEIYTKALTSVDKLCAPYASVIDIDHAQLPTNIEHWSSQQYVEALRHDPNCADFNPSFRQLLHVGYKVAARMGDRYLEMLDECEDSIAENVTTNLYERHLVPLLIADR